MELPFSYVEDDEGKFALVKVVLCAKCVKKLMYKRNKEKEAVAQAQQAAGSHAEGADAVKEEPKDVQLNEVDVKTSGDRTEREERRLKDDSRRDRRRRPSPERERRPRSSRSRSPARRRDKDHRTRPTP